MRDLLRPLEGQLVTFQGRLDKREKQADGTLAVCLANVEIRPHRNDLPLADIPALRFDHLWIRGMDPALVQIRGLLRSQAGLGRVGWYRRDNWTVDLGVTAVEAVSLNAVHTSVKNCGDPVQSCSILSGAIEAIKSGTPYWALGISADVQLQVITSAVERYRRNVVLDWTTYVGSRPTGPCLGLKAADPFSAVRPSRRRSNGFALRQGAG